MPAMKKYALIIISIALFSNHILAQLDVTRGQLTGSVESIIQRYDDDSKTNTSGQQIDQGYFGNNTYLKLDYSMDKLSIGMQYEAFLPALKGYDIPQGQDVVFKYANYKDDFIDITIGNFYEQFGSGILFRSFESRELGINTSIEGIRALITPAKFVRLKSFYGKQRRYFDVSEGTLKGADIELNLGEFLSKETFIILDIGANLLQKNQVYTGSNLNVEPIVNSGSARFNFGINTFSLNAEYAEKEKDAYENLLTGDYMQLEQGKILLVNSSYTKNSFGTSMSFRSLRNMEFRTDRDVPSEQLIINYLPALTKQHKYSLLNIYPYGTQLNNEIGGQADVFYTITKGSFLGGKYGTRLSFNYSYYSEGDSTNLLNADGQKLFQDVNIEIGKKWSKKWRSSFILANQYYDKSKIEGGIYVPVKATILAGELKYKHTSKTSIRTEVQHLWTEQDHYNWMAGLLEVSFAPHWSVFISDMWNYEHIDQIHYYNAGCSFNKNSTSIMLSYGRQREGILCVGGICKKVVGFTGLTLSVNTVF